jgi:hypothetical protein
MFIRFWLFIITKFRLFCSIIYYIFSTIYFLNKIGLFRIIGVLRRRTVMVDFHKEIAFSPEVKAQLVAALKETEELKAAIVHVEQIFISTFTDDNKQEWWKELMEVAGKVIAECPKEIMDGIQGVSGIPTEWKAAPYSAWGEFLIGFCVSELDMLSILWKKPK